MRNGPDESVVVNCPSQPAWIQRVRPIQWERRLCLLDSALSLDRFESAQKLPPRPQKLIIFESSLCAIDWNRRTTCRGDVLTLNAYNALALVLAQWSKTIANNQDYVIFFPLTQRTTMIGNSQNLEILSTKMVSIRLSLSVNPAIIMEPGGDVYSPFREYLGRSTRSLKYYRSASRYK